MEQILRELRFFRQVACSRKTVSSTRSVPILCDTLHYPVRWFEFGKSGGEYCGEKSVRRLVLVRGFSTHWLGRFRMCEREVRGPPADKAAGGISVSLLAG